jgi:hypothetical protein
MAIIFAVVLVWLMLSAGAVSFLNFQAPDLNDNATTLDLIVAKIGSGPRSRRSVAWTCIILSPLFWIGVIFVSVVDIITDFLRWVETKAGI